MSKKSPNPTDKHVGSRVRMRRMMLGLSQTDLANSLDVTFQQVQKYEKGTNRIGASRMAQIAAKLNVPVSWFFEGVQGLGQAPLNSAPDPVAELCSTRDGVALAQAFNAITDPDLRRAVVWLLKRIVGQDAVAEAA